MHINQSSLSCFLHFFGRVLLIFISDNLLHMSTLTLFYFYLCKRIKIVDKKVFRLQEGKKLLSLLQLCLKFCCFLSYAFQIVLIVSYANTKFLSRVMGSLTYIIYFGLTFYEYCAFCIMGKRILYNTWKIYIAIDRVQNEFANVCVANTNFEFDDGQYNKR